MHVDVQLKPPCVLLCSTDGRTVGHHHEATPGQLACSASLALVSFYRVVAPSQSYHVHRLLEAVGSMTGHARGCATEASMCAAVLHRWQDSRAQPCSASRPAGTKRSTRPGHPPSRCGNLQPATVCASRGRQPHVQACTWMRNRSHRMCCRAPPMAGQPGMTMERIQAS